MRVFYFLCFVFVLFSCEKRFAKNDEPFIISKQWEEYSRYQNISQKDKDGNVLPPPPPRYKYGYGYQNFIIDDSSNLFYYQFKPRFTESCIIKDEDTIPYFQDLKPEMLIEIPLNSIGDFVKLNFKKGKRDKVKISSIKDTLNSKTYFDLIRELDNQLDFENDGDVYAIFPSTQEEDTVLYYKKKNEFYFSSQIKWDKKRIRFFSKPKIDE